MKQVVAQAWSALPPSAPFDEFRARVRSLLQQDGIDPDHPDRLTRRNATVGAGTR
jgi:acyl carrier protein phosphodiesterase